MQGALRPSEFGGLLFSTVRGDPVRPAAKRAKTSKRHSAPSASAFGRPISLEERVTRLVKRIVTDRSIAHATTVKECIVIGVVCWRSDLALFATVTSESRPGPMMLLLSAAFSGTRPLRSLTSIESGVSLSLHIEHTWHDDLGRLHAVAYL